MNNFLYPFPDMPPANFDEYTHIQHPRLPTMRQFYEEQQKDPNHSDHHIKKSGIISIKPEGQRKITVCAKVYDNGLANFILLTSKSLMNSKQKYVSLKHAHVVLSGDNSIRITPNKDIDGQSLTIIPSKDVCSWLEVLTPERPRTNSMGSPRIRRAPMLPLLQESDEE